MRRAGFTSIAGLAAPPSSNAHAAYVACRLGLLWGLPSGRVAVTSSASRIQRRLCAQPRDLHFRCSAFRASVERRASSSAHPAKGAVASISWPNPEQWKGERERERAELQHTFEGVLRDCVTLQDAVEACGAALERLHVPEPDISAQYIVAQGAGLVDGRRGLRIHRLNSLRVADHAAIASLCALRAMRVPVQYLAGEWDFHEVNLLVRPPVLIPRPETEELVELILLAARANPARPIRRILDVGTGTGAIILSLLTALPGSEGVAVDASPAAAELARENAARLRLAGRVRVACAPFEAFAEAYAGERFEVLASNPPYIPSLEVDTLMPEVRAYEDRLALDGGPDGMGVIRQLLRHAPRLLVPGGSLWLETDPTHPPLIRHALASLPPGEDGSRLELVSVHLDFCGRQRFCRLDLVPGPGAGAGASSSSAASAGASRERPAPPPAPASEEAAGPALLDQQRALYARLEFGAA
eukprot:tig00001493_g8983.t1